MVEWSSIFKQLNLSTRENGREIINRVKSTSQLDLNSEFDSITKYKQKHHCVRSITENVDVKML